MSSHPYRATATWTHGRKGFVSGEGIPGSIQFSSPPEFMGEAGIWAPEHFLAASVASCFLLTFQAIADFSKLEFLSLQVEVEAFLQKEPGGYSVSKIIIHPLLEIAAAADQERATRILEKSERACLISRSLKSEIELQPEVLVRPAEAVEITPLV